MSDQTPKLRTARESVGDLGTDGPLDRAPKCETAPMKGITNRSWRNLQRAEKAEAEVATLTARCEALEQDKAYLESERDMVRQQCDHIIGVNMLAQTELQQLRVRCEALTAERDKAVQEYDELAERDSHAVDAVCKQLMARCQHLEQAVEAIVDNFWDTPSPQTYDALASLLPTQEETPRTDENRVSFAAGYSEALDDVLKGKP